MDVAAICDGSPGIKRALSFASPPSKQPSPKKKRKAAPCKNDAEMITHLEVQLKALQEKAATKLREIQRLNCFPKSPPWKRSWNRRKQRLRIRQRGSDLKAKDRKSHQYSRTRNAND